MYLLETDNLLYISAFLIMAILLYVIIKIIYAVNNNLHVIKAKEDINNSPDKDKLNFEADENKYNNSKLYSDLWNKTELIINQFKIDIEYMHAQQRELKLDIELIKLKNKELENNILVNEMTGLKQKLSNYKEKIEIPEDTNPEISGAKHKINLSLDKVNIILNSLETFERTIVPSEIQMLALHLRVQAILYKTELIIEMNNLENDRYDANYYENEYDEDIDVLQSQKGKYVSLDRNIKILSKNLNDLLNAWKSFKTESTEMSLKK